MATPDVTLQVNMPAVDADAYGSVSAQIKLVTTTDGTEGWGVWSGGSIGGTQAGTVSSTGLVTFTDVVPNILISPADTYYKVTVSMPGRQGYYTRTIVVPNVVGPTDIDDDNLDTSTSEDLPAMISGQQVIPHADHATPINQPELSDFVELCEAGGAVDLLVVGDSILELSGWGNKVSKVLAARYNTNTTSQWYHGYSAYNGLTSSTGTQVLNGASGQSLQLTSGQSVAITPSGQTTSCAVVYKKSSGAGDILVKRAGSTIETITTANANTSWSNIENSPTTTLGTYVWTFEASGGTVVIEGVYFYSGNESAGVRVWQLGTSGYDCSEWSTLTTVSTFATNLDPDLYVVALGTNDDTANIVTDMTALYNALSTASGAQGVLAVPYESVSCFPADVTLVRDLCATLGAGRIDFDGVIGSVTANNDPWSLSSDSLHPDEAGAWALADVASAVLMGDTIGQAIASNIHGPRPVQATTITASGSIAASGAVTGLSFTTTGNATGKAAVADSVVGTSLGIYNVNTDTQLAGVLASATLINAVFAVNGAGVAFGPGGSTLADTYLARDGVALLRSNGSLRTAGRRFAVATKTGTYTATTNDEVLIGDTTSAGFTITLPAASAQAGQRFVIYKSVAANTLTIARAGSDTINGATTKTITTQYEAIQLVSDGSATWYASRLTAA